MNLSFCKNLISLSLRNSPHLSNKSLFSFSLSFIFFSSQPRRPGSVLVSDFLINRHGFSPETALKASAHKTCIKDPENSDSVLNFLSQSGFSKTHLEKIIQLFPNVLFSNLDKTIKPKIKLFQDLGFSQNDLVDIIASHPSLLKRSGDKRLFPSIVALKNVLGTSFNVSKILKLSGGWFLDKDLEKTMIPNIKFLMSCEIKMSQITKLLLTFPRFFVIKPDKIKALVKRVDELGLDRNSNMFLYAIRVLSSMTLENWELKLHLFRSLGLSEDQILFMFRRIPNVFAVSEKKFREVTDFLLSTSKCNVSFIARYPEILLYSLEGRTKPRIQILEILETKNIVSRGYSLATILSFTDKKFFEKYVSPYKNEIGSLDSAKKD